MGTSQFSVLHWKLESPIAIWIFEKFLNSEKEKKIKNV